MYRAQLHESIKYEDNVFWTAGITMSFFSSESVRGLLLSGKHLPFQTDAIHILSLQMLVHILWVL